MVNKQSEIVPWKEMWILNLWNFGEKRGRRGRGVEEKQNLIFLVWSAFLSFRFNPRKAEQPLQSLELKEKKHKKIKAYRKLF